MTLVPGDDAKLPTDLCLVPGYDAKLSTDSMNAPLNAKFKTNALQPRMQERAMPQ
jgi:hypothetical protein